MAGAAPPAVLSDSREDVNYIIVEKQFVGLSPQEIPADFQISVTSGQETYLLNGANTLRQELADDGTVRWSWRLTGVGTGAYLVSEEHENAEGYRVTASGGGTVEVKAAGFAVSVPVHETTCSHVNWPVRVDGDDNVLFAATLTQGGIAVISKTPLSASQRATVSDALLKINGPWKKPVYFYSIEEQLQNGVGFELNGATITYDTAAEEVIIGKTRNWQHVATVSYSISAAANPEIALVNTYERALTDVTVSKKVTGSMADPDRRFAFTVSVKLGADDAAFTVDGVPHIGQAQFSLKHGESIVLRDIPQGAAVTVAEIDNSGGYAVSYAVEGGPSRNGAEVTLTAVEDAGHTVLFTNAKDAVPDTGAAPETLPYALLLALAFAGIAAFLLRRKIGR